MPIRISKESVCRALSSYDQHKGFLKRINFRKDTPCIQKVRDLVRQIDHVLLTDEEVFKLAQFFYDHPIESSHETYKAFLTIFGAAEILSILLLFKKHQIILTADLWTILLKILEGDELDPSELYMLVRCFYEKTPSKENEFSHFFEGILGASIVKILSQLRVLMGSEPLSEELFSHVDETLICVLNFLKGKQCLNYRDQLIERYVGYCYEDQVSHLVIDLPFIASLFQRLQAQGFASQEIIQKIIEYPQTAALIRVLLERNLLTEAVIQKVSANSPETNEAVHLVLNQLQEGQIQASGITQESIVQLSSFSHAKRESLSRLLTFLAGLHLNFPIELATLYDIIDRDNVPFLIQAVEQFHLSRLTPEIFQLIQENPQLSLMAINYLKEMKVEDEEQVFVFYPPLHECLRLWTNGLLIQPPIVQFPKSPPGQIFHSFTKLYQTWSDYKKSLVKDLPPMGKDPTVQTAKEKITELKYQKTGELLATLHAGTITQRLTCFNSYLSKNAKTFETHRDRKMARCYLITRNILLGIATVGILPFICWLTRSQWFFDCKPTRSQKMVVKTQSEIGVVLAKAVRER